MKGYGVRRLVIINSGSYRFADLALDGPIHLVAPNNRGKSTLVNALQFLYVDDVRSMRFPKSPEETREHYFGNAVSYLVFECVTATGPQSLLVVGRGRVNGSAFARYVFSGEYRTEDFQDSQGRVVSFEVLRGRLADRSLAEVRPAELWEVLSNPARRARPEHNGHLQPHLGLLPIRTKEDYRSFRETYVRLLSLSDANAAELRRLLIACHAAEVGEVRLDVAADYRDEFERAERTDNRLAFLRAAGTFVDQGETVRAQIESNAQALHALAPEGLAEAAALRAALLGAGEQISHEESKLDAAHQVASERGSQANRQIGGAQSELDRVSKEIAELDRLHAEWSTCSSDVLQAMRDNADTLQDRIAERREHLRQAGTFDLEAMRRSAGGLRGEVDSQGRSLSNWEHRLSAWLLAQGLTPKHLADSFRVLNPALLHLLVGEDVAVTDQPKLLSRLRELSASIKKDIFADSDVRVRLGSIAGPTAGDLRDPETARQGLKLLQQRLEEELRRLAVAENTDRATAELAELVTQHGQARARLAEHDRYHSRWNDRPALQDQAEAIRATIAGAEKTLRDVAKDDAALAQNRRELAEKSRAIGELLRQTGLAHQNCQSALEVAQVVFSESDAATEQSAPTNQPLAQLQLRAERCCKTLNDLGASATAIRNAREQLKGLQRQIARTSQEFAGQQVYFSDEDADWVELVDARRALTELEQTTAQSWETLFTTISAKLDALVRGARAIGNAAVRINTAMRRHRVSNLREVKLDVTRQHEACDLLESLTRPDGLFTDREALGRAKDQLRRWIKDGKVIQLDDLFAVRIGVQGMDGQWIEARSLDDIGSTGTGMTAKAMIFIQLVRAVVADERYRLHFYLDETGQLDDQNLQATTGMAVERGIIPITAEPRVRVEPLTHPTVTVYGLGQSADGLFYIDQRRTLRAARRVGQSESTHSVAEPA